MNNSNPLSNFQYGNYNPIPNPQGQQCHTPYAPGGDFSGQGPCGGRKSYGGRGGGGDRTINQQGRGQGDR